MKKALFVATVVKTHIMQFHLPYLKMLKEMGFETAVAAKNDYENPEDCSIPYCDNYYNIPFERNPFKTANIAAYKQLKKLLDEQNYTIIHCHTPVGGFITRLAASQARKKGSIVFYTAHGFHFYTGAPFINWLLYYPAERWMAHKTDVLITINQEDYKRAEHFKADKIVYMPGVGIDTEKFSVSCDTDNIRKELSLTSDDFIILSIGELIARKNHIVVIEAVDELKKEGKANHLHYIICGQGKLWKDLENHIKELGLENQIHLLGYRKDISNICHSSDAFVFMSLQEGLPVALMEAMASGLPVICSAIRGNTDLIQNGKNGLTIKNNNKKEIAEAISLLMNNPELRQTLAESSVETIRQYDIRNVTALMKNLYLEALSSKE